MRVPGYCVKSLPRKKQQKRMCQTAGPITIFCQSIQRHDPGMVIEIGFAFIANDYQVARRGDLFQSREQGPGLVRVGWHQAQFQPAALELQPVLKPPAQLASRIIKHIQCSHSKGLVPVISARPGLAAWHPAKSGAPESALASDYGGEYGTKSADCSNACHL